MASLIPRLFPPPVFDHLQYANTNTGGGKGLGVRLITGHNLVKWGGGFTQLVLPLHPTKMLGCKISTISLLVSSTETWKGGFGLLPTTHLFLTPVGKWHFLDSR